MSHLSNECGLPTITDCHKKYKIHHVLPSPNNCCTASSSILLLLFVVHCHCWYLCNNGLAETKWQSHTVVHHASCHYGNHGQIYLGGLKFVQNHTVALSNVDVRKSRRLWENLERCICIGHTTWQKTHFDFIWYAIAPTSTQNYVKCWIKEKTEMVQ